MSYKNHLTKFAWFGLGLWMNYSLFFILWIATEDILSGSLHSTAIVLLAFTVPDILSKAVISPWLVERISFRPAFIIYSFLLVAIQLTFVFVNIIDVRLAGMCILGVVNGLGTITVAKLLGFYKESAGVCQSGVNCASFVASISYTGLTTWICLSPRVTIAILSPLALLPVLIYALLDKEPLQSNTNYTEQAKREENEYLIVAQDKIKKSEKATIGRQLKTLFNEFLVIYYGGTATLLVTLTLTTILSTLTFKSSPFPPRDHYQYYRFLFDFGKMLGGMELSLLSFFCPRFLNTIRIRRIWILMLLDVGLVMVFLTVSWFHYTDNVYIILILCFTFGVTSGCIFVHNISLAADLFTNSRKLGKVLGYLEVSLSVGRLSAGLLGLFVEKYLREHCGNRLLLGKFCLARLSSPGMWSTSNC